MATKLRPNFIERRTMDSDTLLLLREVERRLGLTRWTLYKLIRAGKLPAVKLSSGHYRVREDIVRAMASGAKVGPGGGGQDGHDA